MATCVSGCGVCIECRAATPITMYFYRLILQKCNFSKAQRKLPEVGPDGPKLVGAKYRHILIVSFNILYV